MKCNIYSHTLECKVRTSTQTVKQSVEFSRELPETLKNAVIHVSRLSRQLQDWSQTCITRKNFNKRSSVSRFQCSCSHKSRHISGGAKEFCPNFPNLALKIIFGPLFVRIRQYFFMTTVCGMTSKRKKVFLWFWPGREPFSHIKIRSAPFLSVFSGSLPTLSAILRRLSQILPGFSPNQSFDGAPGSPLPKPLLVNITFVRFFLWNCNMSCGQWRTQCFSRYFRDRFSF